MTCRCRYIMCLNDHNLAHLKYFFTAFPDLCIRFSAINRTTLGYDAEMNTMTECTITVPLQWGKKERDWQGVKRESDIKRGGQRTEEVLGCEECKICRDREQYGRR